MYIVFVSVGLTGCPECFTSDENPDMLDHLNTDEDVRGSFVYTTFNVVQGDVYRWRYVQ